VPAILECKNEIADLKYVMSGRIKDLANKINRLTNENQSLKRSQNSLIEPPLKNHLGSTQSNLKIIL